MPSEIKSRPGDFRVLLFAVLSVVCGALTVRAVVRGHDELQTLLLGMLTVYALSIALNTIVRISHLKRYAAIPLGVTGTVVYVVGVPTDLPILFMILGTGAVIDLIWDPTGTVYNDQSGSG
ncbi:hypothetical protein [Halobellus ruber]|uniref:Uncharacterized protein n=1 Tax=Halobellus ruber TaxID=2761102 RepID=A0A7J9SHT1_9EURY|nr:hypothetical protein [Halobellus ruber]MBB6645527.1 hypothetical protein [Halobellus ruber]